MGASLKKKEWSKENRRQIFPKTKLPLTKSVVIIQCFQCSTLLHSIHSYGKYMDTVFVNCYFFMECLVRFPWVFRAWQIKISTTCLAVHSILKIAWICNIPYIFYTFFWASEIKNHLLGQNLDLSQADGQWICQALDRTLLTAGTAKYLRISKHTCPRILAECNLPLSLLLKLYSCCNRNIFNILG